MRITNCDCLYKLVCKAGIFIASLQSKRPFLMVFEVKRGGSHKLHALYEHAASATFIYEMDFFMLTSATLKLGKAQK